ncbi:Alpha/Beta hydrolase protein, partial [Gamsiella multidivaricata]|uniref:Alpha/Beta hydrolase protein n=1 Tax=Gamsiella multidivaricata TaxID=101098 RepID=UPI002220966E
MVLSTILALYLGYKAFRLIEARQRENAIQPSPTSPVLVNHFQFVTVNGKRLRIVHIPHELGSKVPLLVFIHGVGGQLEQFEKQIEYFSHSTHILAIDMCGYGASDVPDSFEHYTTDAFTEDIVVLLQRYKSEDTVLICHSYGCAVGTHLYSRLETLENLNNSIKAMVMIGPKAIITQHELESREQLRRTPDWAVNLARHLDRMGGIHSKSVDRL